MSIFEALMMLGFGLAWPFNISRSLRTKTAAGKSFLFMITIEFAYICGMIHKILHNFDWVFWLYVLNFVMVGITLHQAGRFSQSAPASPQTPQPKKGAAITL